MLLVPKTVYLCSTKTTTFHGLLVFFVKQREITNGKLICNSIMNGPHVRRMILEPRDRDREVPVAETFHEQTDDELTKKEVKKMEADDQAIQTILMGLPEDIYTAVDSYETAKEIWLHVQQMIKGSDIGIQEKKDHNNSSRKQRKELFVCLFYSTYDPQTDMVTEDEEMLKDNEIDKLMALISLSFKKIYKPTNNNFRTSSNTSRANQDNSQESTEALGMIIRRAVNVVGAREMYEEAGVQLNAEQTDWRDDTDDESEDQELEAHYMYMAQIHEVTPDSGDNSGLIFDDEPMHKVQNNNDNYNVFAMENAHPEQPESNNHIYLVEHGDTNITIDSLDICYDRVQDDQDDTDDLDQEHDLLLL
ncbi:hypothetical protein Tco_0952894 [Tanacetum coccineum]|uniref:Uncharacterized protein n=1 Tax=Tanacetum coccineum TaxID=301880 RepID=A0ABQ5DZ99_9ASTR